ncbi:2OG-Fe(II) oxygenase [Dactylosporangium sp. CA-139114]|uniref:2OG-Fe(II) oxygenase n=1 Tax=Dactylosporangium sp. CA-139114 TaxID=3239931 RepID=UPI003D97466F
MTISADLDDVACAPIGRLLEDADCRELAALFEHDEHFRSTVDMARHRFGSGRYKYFRRPYPTLIEELRQQLYPQLLPIARDWAARLRRPAPWPNTLDEWTAMCHEAGQRRSTAILLRYESGDWNALHRDLYGELVFPLQVVIGLSGYGTDYTGGEFMLVEQRPRAQSRGTAVPLVQGHGLDD